MLHLHTLWFILLAVLWVGFFVLEGFDFGVGALHTIVGRTDTERRVAINTIGPWWDGNEVWLIVAGAGTFAAFPGWYATMFSALYLALLLVLAALIARGVAFEFKGKSEDPRWRTTWTWCMTIGSLLIPLLVGVGLGDLLVRPADRLRPQLHRQLLRTAHPVRPVDRPDAAGALPAARRDLPEAENHRSDARAGPRARAAPRLDRDRVGAGLRDLDAAIVAGQTCPARSRSSR